MKKEYIIIDVTVIHPKLGEMKKQSIQYFINGKFDSQEFYDETVEIRFGYVENKELLAK